MATGTPAPRKALEGGTAAENAKLFRGLLTDEEGPRRDVVCLNAGAALFVAGTAESLSEGVTTAREAIEGGGAGNTLEAFIRFTRGWRG